MASKSAQLKALILDDEPIFEKLFTLSMAMLDWKCEVVGDWNEALSRLKSKHFDLLITDYHMPEGNGLHFILLLRQQGITLPAILMSGDRRMLELTPKHLLNIPMVLRKPFNLQELSDALKIASSAPVPTPPPTGLPSPDQPS